MQRALRKLWCLPLLILLAAPVFYGCEGSAPREQVDDAVKELSGQKKVEQMDQMKKQLDVIGKKHADQLKQVEEK